MDTKDIDASLINSVPKGLFVDGQWIDSGRSLQVFDPATGEPLCEVSDAREEDGMRALAAASKAQREWGRQPSRERSEILRTVFDAIDANAEDYARLISLEMGKPLAEAMSEVRYGAEFLRWYSEEAARMRGDFVNSPTGNGRILTMRQPVGPCILITPWNFPLAMGTRKIGAAVAAGCTMLMKPAHQTPLTMLRLAEDFAAAGLPDGVLNVLPTSEPQRLIGPLLTDSRARKLSFTGSTQVGRALLRQAADGVMRVSMELGGNAPFIVFDDADLELAVSEAVVAKMRNMGESCIAANRMYVHRDVIDPFVEAFAEEMSQLVMGPGTQEGVDVGPMIDLGAQSDIHDRVTEAVAVGGRVVTGGQLPDSRGYFYEPTVIRDVPGDARLLREETFGPVAPVVPFADESEVIASANDSEHGLAAYCFTENLDRAFRVAESIESGMVGINRGVISDPAAPFGGIKHSGLGREGGAEGIVEFLETKYVAL